MRTVLTCVALAAVLASGCADPSGPKPDGKDEKTKGPDAFKKPAPGTVADDPRVIHAKLATDATARALATIRERLAALRTSYDDKAAAEKDLKGVVQKMLPLVKAAREDCDTIHRAVTDLRIELKFARAGYESAAELYRQRAAEHSDPDLRKITAGMADEFDRLAADVPKRQTVLTAFCGKLSEVDYFLTDTQRCLYETEAALAILSAGPEPATVLAQSKGFRKQLDDFITTVEEYQRKLLGWSTAPSESGNSPPAASSAPEPADAGASAPERRATDTPVPQAGPTSDANKPASVQLPPGHKLAPAGSPVIGTPPSELDRVKR